MVSSISTELHRHPFVKTVSVTEDNYELITWFGRMSALLNVSIYFPRWLGIVQYRIVVPL